MVLNRLRILSPDETEADLRNPDGALPETIPALLEAARRSWGDKVAFQQKVRREWTRYSHHDIYERSHRLAAGLIDLGLQKGDRVVIIMENGIDWVCAAYAIVLTGAIAVPIYYDLKPSEVEEMVRHSAPSIAIVSPKASARMASALQHVGTVLVAGDTAEDRPALSLEDVEQRATPSSRETLRRIIVEPDDLATIMFTSGTTGGMKGVTLTHRNFLANCKSVRCSIPFGARDRLVMVLPLHHAFPFLVSLIVAPAVGGEVTFETDLRRIRDRMAEVKPTLFLGVPALLELMYRNVLQRIETEGRMSQFEFGLRLVEGTKQRTGINIGRIVFRELHKRMGGSLRFIVCGAAALNPQLAQNFARIGIPVLQGWGLTEAAPVLAVQRWNPRKFYTTNYYEEHVGTVGQSLDGVEIGLIDVPEKELYVHLHGEGELVARGDNITPGYWHADDATKAAKVGGWLRTGDVGSIDADGNIWITGRSKYVIVLDSGEKVHPDEIEEKIGRSPLLEDVVVIQRRLRGKAQVCAVVYPNRDEVLAALAGKASTEDSVRKLVSDAIAANSQDIAPYKRVADVMLTDVPLPKTAILKVARGQIGESYSFDPYRWEQTWRELQDANAILASPDEAEEALATA